MTNSSTPSTNFNSTNITNNYQVCNQFGLYILNTHRNASFNYLIRFQYKNKIIKFCFLLLLVNERHYEEWNGCG